MTAQEYFLSFPRFGNSSGLSSMKALMERLGNPQEGLRFVHVAGTNGKGSVTTMLASVSRAAGLKTGCYTSPYITCFRERMQIDGQPVSPEELEELAGRLRPEIEWLEKERGLGFCHFEVVTAAAFCWFAQKGCQLVCLEVGLGGRLDATNLISPQSCALSVLTALGFDHMELLGDTMEQIAYEKCGIIKEGAPVVCYPHQPEEALEVIFRTAALRGCAVILPNPGGLRDLSPDSFSPRFSYGGREYTLRLLGAHQLKNAVTAIEAARVLQGRGFSSITQEAIDAGLKSAFLPARLELIPRWGGRPPLLIDGAHNPHGCRALAQFLARAAGEGKGPVALVMGMLADKNVEQALEALLPAAREIFMVPVDNPRAMDPEELARRAAALGGRAVCCQTLSQGLEKARALAGEEGLVAVCGSLYLAAQARALPETDKNHGPDGL